MKMVKNIAALLVASTFMFGGVSFHMSNVYTNMDDATTVDEGFGASWALNENTSIGWDSALGMIFAFDVPAGVSLRLTTGSTAVNGASSGFGLGYTWWTGGTGLKTSISTSYDMVTDNDGRNAANNADVDAMGKLSLTVGFGF